MLEFKTSTGKVIDIEKIKFDFVSENGYRLVLSDYSDVYVTVQEYEEIKKLYEEH